MGETILRPRRAKLAEAHAVVYGCTPAELAGVRERLPDPNVEPRRTWVVRIAQRVPMLVADAPTAPYVAVRQIVFERREWTDGSRQWSTWEPVPDITNPAEAWEALAARGVIPGDWVENPRRVFAIERPTYADGATGELGSDGSVVRWTLAHPPDVAACVAIAADMPGVLAAEAIAREVTGCARVVWRVEPRERIVKRMRERGIAWSRKLCAERTPAEDVLGFHAAALDATVTQALGPSLRPGETPGDYLEARRIIFPATLAAESRLTGLLATGYALDAIDDDTATLVCPELP